MTAVVELVGVHRHHRRGSELVRALNGVDLTLSAGELTAVLGPSGSGKTSMVNIAIGWDRPDEGTVTRSPTITADWQGIAVIPQRLGLLPELTAAENIGLPIRLGGEQRGDGPTVIGRLGIGDLAGRLPHELSLGEQQRVAIARALVTRSALLVADEPTAHQDEERIETVVGLLRSAAEGGAAVLVATHDRRVHAMADRVVELCDGAVVSSTG